MRMSKTKTTPKESSVPTGTDTATEHHGKPKHAATTAVQRDLSKVLQGGIGKSPPPTYEGKPVSLGEIGEWLSKETGVEISPQTMFYIVEQLKKKVRLLLFKDPHIRDYLWDNNFEYLTKDDSECT